LNLHLKTGHSWVALLILSPPVVLAHLVFSPFRQVGQFSYSLYLIHVPVGCYLLPHYFLWKSDRHLWPSLVQDVILFTGSLLAAYLFYCVAEKPSHEFARRIKLGRSNESESSKAMPAR